MGAPVDELDKGRKPVAQGRGRLVDRKHREGRLQVPAVQFKFTSDGYRPANARSAPGGPLARSTAMSVWPSRR
jgi:hypothetical protein